MNYYRTKFNFTGLVILLFLKYFFCENNYVVYHIELLCFLSKLHYISALVFFQRDLQRHQSQISELELRNEQQKKVLKIKTEEMAAVQRRFRNSAHIHTR